MQLYSRLTTLAAVSVFLLIAAISLNPVSMQEAFAKSPAPAKKLLIAKKTKKTRKKGDETVVTVVTNKGPFQIQIFEEDVPVTSAHFLSLVKEGFYNGLTFHRYDPSRNPDDHEELSLELPDDRPDPLPAPAAAGA